MTKRKSRKELITETVRKLLPKKYTDFELSTDVLLYRWWFTARTGTGLRLTDEGKEAFEVADIAFYEYDISFKDRAKDFKPEKFVLELNKKLDCPFYLGVKKQGNSNTTYIRLYDHKIAMVLTLYGNIFDYLDSIKVKK